MALPERRHAAPLLKWVGGKRDMSKLLSDAAYRHLSKQPARAGMGHLARYIEPFLGGGAVALDLGLPNMLLSDLCGPLINCYEWVRKAPDSVVWALDLYAKRGTDKETYNVIRGEQPKSRVQAAAWFIYLNTVGYNGVWRVNSQGTMNVPHGRTTSGKYNFPTLDDLRAFGEAIKTATLRCGDFDEPIKTAKAGDFIYADPPYFGVYDDYTEYGFDERDQADLANMLHEAADRGVAVLTTNSAAPEIRELYAWAHVTETAEKRRVNRDADKRGPVGCLLIASSPTLLG